MLTKKEQVLKHHQDVINFIHSLEALTEEQWRSPISIGKWTIAEVVGHLITWDEFILHNRLTLLLLSKTFTKGSRSRRNESNCGKKSTY
ncbi:DinB family protein [Alkalihalobacillus pseudalcaliphilus]|uniref:DinB family protein n=1 Tax=Alkalihalobacillus pseudalcaliphilus TaxID=79884 RepID=UPI00069E2353|nr:DinB family protein [Alkalihalobacillus pseudalcaliphilus]